MSSQARSVIVAAGQTVALPLSGAYEALAAVARLARQAAGAGADLVVLPECAYPAYWIESIETYRRAPIWRSADYVDWLRGLARDLDIHIASGFIEERGDALADSAVLIGPDGRELGRHRKTFLWGRDNDWFAAGNRIDVFDSPLGRIGLTICAEARCPEVAATLAAKGADLIAMVTCWFNTGRAPGEYTNPQVEFMMESRAREFGTLFVCADKSGRDGDHVGYCGRSLIIGAAGERLAEAPAMGEALLVSRVALGEARNARITDEERTRLLATAGPAMPGADSGTVTIAAIPGRITHDLCAGRADEAFTDSLLEKGARIVVSPAPDAVCAERVRAAMLARGIAFVGGADRRSAYDIGGPDGRPGLRVGCLDGDAVARFAPARVAALEGAAAILASGPLRDDVDLRTRAAENRIWAVAATEDRAVVVAPDGSVTARSRPNATEPLIVAIDPVAAANKMVTPGTHVFAQRRVRAYSF